MIRSAKKLWYRLPVDGAGAITLFAAKRQRLFQSTAARGFWKRMPRGTRLIAMTVARTLWLAACPMKTVLAPRYESTKSRDLAAALWAGWIRGWQPAQTIQWRALAQGDRRRLEILRRIPGDRCGGLLLAALGDTADMKLASDKLATAHRLAELGARVPVTHEAIRPGTIPDTGAPWYNSGPLVIKPRHGMASRGLSAIVPASDGYFSLDGAHPVSRAELAHQLMLRTRGDDLLVQSHVAPADGMRDLSPDAPITVRVFVLRPSKTEEPRILSAFLKIIPPGRYVPRGIIDLLVVPVNVRTGVLESGILFNRPGERWPSMPWNGAPVRGLAVSCWPDVAAVALRASEILPRTPLIGWDILLGSEGPVVLEANTGVSLLRAALGLFEQGLESPLIPALEKWCIENAARRQ